MATHDPVPDVVAPPPGHPRFPLLDGLRAVAALGVLVSHAGYLSAASEVASYGPLVANGTVGVTIFFVLSGFLLYRPMLAAAVGGAPRVPLRDYLRRRALRILPAYWLALTVIALVLPLRDVFTGDWWRWYVLLQVYDPRTVAGGLAAAWSLCIEVSFYLYLPVHALLMGRLARATGADRGRRRVRLELAVLAVLALGSIALRAWSLGRPGHGLSLTLPTTFSWFALGMSLAVLSVGPVPARLTSFVARRPAVLWAVAAALYVVLCRILRTPADGVLVYTDRQWMAQHVLSGLLAVALVAPAALGDRAGGWPRRVLAWRPLALAGVISYGVYLWQGLWVDEGVRHGVLGWTGAPFVTLAVVTAAASLATAAVSYRVLERPLMRLKRGPRPGRPATPRTRAGAASARAPVPDSAPGSRR